jgi:hypothetical protein
MLQEDQHASYPCARGTWIKHHPIIPALIHLLHLQLHQLSMWWMLSLPQLCLVLLNLLGAPPTNVARLATLETMPANASHMTYLPALAAHNRLSLLHLLLNMPGTMTTTVARLATQVAVPGILSRHLASMTHHLLVQWLRLFLLLLEGVSVSWGFHTTPVLTPLAIVMELLHGHTILSSRYIPDKHARCRGNTPSKTSHPSGLNLNGLRYRDPLVNVPECHRSNTLQNNHQEIST